MNELLLFPPRIRRRVAACLAVPMALALCLLPFATAQARPAMRIALICDGPNDEFHGILTALARNLRAMEIIRHAPPADMATKDTADLWQWLSAHAEGSQLIFLEDGFYRADWVPAQRIALRERLRTRLVERRDVDLILAFGTWAGQDMAHLDTTVPVIVCGVTDAIGAGIVPSVEDSGKDNLIAVMEPGRFQRQITLFHKIFAFRKLGITYKDTPVGRSVVALAEIESACAERGVELVRCTDDFSHNPNSTQIVVHMEACHRKFVEKNVDAVYMTHNSLHTEHLRRVMEPLIKARIPIFSQTGSREVKMGALASVTSYSAEEGRFVAVLLRRLLEGAQPRSLPQRFRSPRRLTINLRTAANIGWNPSLEILLIVNEFFQ